MKIEVWSDIVCPWCYIGKRRMEAALERLEGGEEVELVWRSFELDPSAPARQERPLDEGLAQKYRMGLGQARQMLQQMTNTAAQEGLEFRFDEAKGGNTFDAHRLIHLAHERGLGDACKERLLRAYFTEGRDIGDHETLVELVAEVGLDAEEARAVLAGDAFGQAVRADERRAHQIGVSGVPFFLIDEKYGVSGAQPVETLVQVLQRVKAEAPKNSAPVCGPDGCEVDATGS